MLSMHCEGLRALPRSWAPTLLCAFGFLVNFLPGDAFLAPYWREAGDAAAPIDVDADGADDDATFRWQADGGSAGWMDFDDASNAVAERARKSGATETRFVNQYGSYTLKLDFMVQVNTHTGTTRPVRYVS